MRTRRSLTLLLLGSGACGQSANTSEDSDVTASAEIRFAAPSLRARHGQITSQTFSIRRRGYEGPVELVVLGLPDQVIATHLLITQDASEGRLQLSASNQSVPQGPFAATINARVPQSGQLLTSITMPGYVAGPPGSVDSNFGDQGVAVHHFAERTWAQVNSIAVDTTQRLVLSGFSLASQLPTVGWVARLTGDGTRDQSFGDDGVVMGFEGDGSEATTHAALPQDSGIVVLATQRIGNETHQYLRRLGNDGTVDATFAADAWLPSDNTWLNVAPRSQGYLLIGTTGLLAIDQYGAIDPSFAAPPGISFDIAAAAVASNDSIVFAGETADEYTLGKLRSDGTTDLEFGDNGFLTAALPPGGASGRIRALGLVPTGGGVAIGEAKIGSAASSRIPQLLRFLEDGTRDPNFGTDGVATLLAAGTTGSVLNAVVHPDGSGVAVALNTSAPANSYLFRPFAVDGSVGDDIDIGPALAVSGMHPFAVAIDYEALRLLVAGRGPDGAIFVSRFWL